MQGRPPAKLEPAQKAARNGVAGLRELTVGYARFLRENCRYLFLGFLVALTSSFGQTHFIAAFASDIRASFALSQGQWGGIYAASTVASAIVMIWAGGLTDKVGVRLLGAGTMLLLSVACFAISVAQGSAALVLIIFLLRFAGQGMLGLISGVAMARWFVAARGKALAISSLGFACGQAVMPLIVVSLLPHFHWRAIWIGAGVALLGAAIITLALLRQDRIPKARSVELEATGMAGAHWTRKQVLHHPLIWLMLPAMIGPPAWSTALFFHQVNLAQSKGWALMDFVGLFPMLAMTSVIFTFFIGWLIDRVGATRIVRFTMLPFAAAFAVLAHAQSIGGATLGLFLFGVSMGLTNTLLGAFWAEIYGTRYLGSIKSLTAATMVFGTALGPGVTGMAIDLGYPFSDQMQAIAVYFLLAFVSTIFALRLVKSAKRSVT